MDKNKTKFWIDFCMFISFLIIAISGFVLWLVLPRGSGKLGNGFIFLRETWILIHNWFSVLLIILILIHLILNYTWIKYMLKNMFKKNNV